MSARKEGKAPPVAPPLKYRLMEIASEMNQRHLNVSYFELLNAPSYILQDYIDMRDLEYEYGMPDAEGVTGK